MEPKELSSALLQPQVTVVATLGEVLATLPTREEEEMMLKSPKRLHRGLKEFTDELWLTLHCTDDTWWHQKVTDDDDGGVTSLSRALAAYRSTPGTTQNRVTMAASKWQWSVFQLVNSWARLARAATELCDTCRDLATKAADRAGTATTQGRELQAQAARDGTALERMGELGQALGGKEGAQGAARPQSLVREEAMMTASEETRVGQRLEAALGPLQRLVAACDKATEFPQELQRLLRDIETTLKDTSMFFRTVPEDLVAKAAEAERLWEANNRLAKDHLVGVVDDFINCYFTGGPAGPGPCGVAERCQRAIEDIPRLLQPPEHPQHVPEESPMGTEPQELSPALLKPQVTVVATLGELLDTLPTREEETLLESPKGLHRDLEEFTKELRATLHCIDDTWWHQKVTDDDDGGVTSLNQVQAAYRSTPLTTWLHVTMAASEWKGLVPVLVNRWARLARAATELRDTCRVPTETLTTQGRELQAQAARDGTALERMGELGQALGGEEGAQGAARPEPPVREEARVAASEETRVGQRREAALGPLERLVAACDKATAFPRELQRLLRDTKAAMEGTKKKFPDVPKDLVAKVAEAERLWEANTRLVKDHLLGAVDSIIDICSKGSSASPNAREVAERCQRAIKDISRLLQTPEHPQSVPEVFPVSMEPHKLSPAMLQPQVTVVATLGELLDTLPREEEMMLESSKCLHKDLVKFIIKLSVTLHNIDNTWWRHIVTDDDDDPATSLSRALSAYRSTPQTTRNRVAMAASEWQRSVSVLVDSWAQVTRKTTELRDTWSKVATEAKTAELREMQTKTARDGTCEEHKVELGQALGGEEGAEGAARTEFPVREGARVAASEATTATMVRQRVEAALGPLECLVAACDEATEFPQELQRLLRDTKTALEGTSEVFPTVPEDLVAKVAVAERLWEANIHLAKDHLVGIIEDFLDLYSKGGRARPSAREVAKRCQRVIEDIPNLLQDDDLIAMTS